MVAAGSEGRPCCRSQVLDGRCQKAQARRGGPENGPEIQWNLTSMFPSDVKMKCNTDINVASITTQQRNVNWSAGTSGRTLNEHPHQHHSSPSLTPSPSPVATSSQASAFITAGRSRSETTRSWQENVQLPIVCWQQRPRFSSWVWIELGGFGRGVWVGMRWRRITKTLYETDQTTTNIMHLFVIFATISYY